jgi:hypothetical protein
MICGAAIAFAVKVWQIQAASLLVVALVGFYSLFRIEKIGRERPEIALLEGAELILWQHQQMNLQAKHMDSPPIEPKSMPYQVPTETKEIEKQAEEAEEKP